MLKIFLRFFLWFWGIFLIVSLIRSDVPITIVYPLLGIVLITEHFLGSPINTVSVAVVLTFLGFFGLILIRGNFFDILTLLLEILWIWIIFAILQKLQEETVKKYAHYEEQNENLEIELNEANEELKKLPEEINKLNSQYQSFSKLNSIASDLGMILYKDKLTEKIKEIGEKIISHGKMDLCLDIKHTELVDPFCKWVIENKYPLLIKDVFVEGKILTTDKNHLDYRSTIISPVEMFGKIVGYIQMKSNKFYTEDEFRLFTIFSGIASISLTNAELFKKIHDLAITDDLTGLYVHRFFKERIEEEFDRAKSYNLPLSLIMIDIDHFKRINDTYGHSCGDEILKQLTKVLRKRARVTDIVARYGGEEFAVLMVQTGIEDAFQVAEEIRKIVEDEVFTVERPEDRLLKHLLRLKVTVSIGVSEITKGMKDFTDLINSADSALYMAKKNGRNRVEKWTG